MGLQRLCNSIINKTQKETKHNKMSEMQTAGKNQGSTMNNIVTVSAITEYRKIEKKKHMYILCRYSQVLWQAMVARLHNRTSKIRL